MRQAGVYPSQGPWKLCFKVHRGGSYRPPSLLLELSYFTVNHRSLVGCTPVAEPQTFALHAASKWSTLSGCHAWSVVPAARLWPACTCCNFRCNKL